MFKEIRPFILPITNDLFLNKGIELYLLNEDSTFPYVSGNKLWKLKYNLLEARKQKKQHLLSFGGKYSNHIYALAAAGQYFGFKTLGIIRGEEGELNSTLSFAKKKGMELNYVTRKIYRERNNQEYLADIQKKYKNYYVIPEGGSSSLGVKGCSEVLNKKTKIFDFICCACGTGGTLKGLALSAEQHQKVLGFSALKTSSSLIDQIKKNNRINNWKLIDNYHFGGYAKITSELVHFINEFYNRYAIKLDGVYTGKAMFGLFDLIRLNYFPKGSKILFIHTGGLQGNHGLEKRLNVKFTFKS